jgi:hypothetical protein
LHARLIFRQRSFLCFDLVSDDGEDPAVDAVELVEAAPRAAARQALQELGERAWQANDFPMFKTMYLVCLLTKDTEASL